MGKIVLSEKRLQALKKLNITLRDVWRNYGLLFTFSGILFGALSWFLSTTVDIKSILEPGIKVDVGEVVGAIDEGNEKLDQLLPADAVERLARRGYMFSQFDFVMASENGDTAAIELFCAAAGPDFIEVTAFRSPAPYREAVVAALSNCQIDYSTFSCSEVNEVDQKDYEGYRLLLEAEKSHGLVKLACGSGFLNERERKIIASLKEDCQRELANLESFVRRVDLTNDLERFFAAYKIMMPGELSRHCESMLSIDLEQPFNDMARRVANNDWP